ncbi:MAG TPA: hypothetical protein PK951_08590, partial [Chitinophagaceae bacterium]|nr:hypothetical protein [Chitinophagaceae bacterium]
MQFRDIIGQHGVKHNLVEMVNHNRLSHALLFTSKEGFGGLPLAIAFAQYMVCDKVNGSKTNDAPSLFGESVPATKTETLT